MLYVLFGNSVVDVRKKAFALVSKYEEDGFELERIEGERYVVGLCRDIASSTSLFGQKTVYLLDTPSSNPLFLEEVETSLEVFKESGNIYLVVEEKLLAPAKKLYEKYAETLEEIKASTSVRFNVFALADSVSLKDKKTLWLQLQEAKIEGLSAEEIIGTLWWQLKTLRLAKITRSGDEAGIKDFPYNKAKRALKNFKGDELEVLSRSLLAVYHDGHGGKRDIDLALEKWTLTI